MARRVYRAILYPRLIQRRSGIIDELNVHRLLRGWRPFGLASEAALHTQSAFSSAIYATPSLANAIQTECVSGSTASVCAPFGVSMSPKDLAPSTVSCKTVSLP